MDSSIVDMQVNKVLKRVGHTYQIIISNDMVVFISFFDVILLW